MKYRIITAWGICNEPVYHVQYLKRGLFGKMKWRTSKHYIHDTPLADEFDTVQEAQKFIKYAIERDNFKPRIIEVI